MQQEKAQAIAELCKQNGFSAEVDKAYSGRGMYGATTFAVITNAPWQVIFNAFGDSLRRDNMAFDWVIY